MAAKLGWLKRSRREAAVLRMRAEGLSFREIGRRLNVSQHTIRTVYARAARRKPLEEILRSIVLLESAWIAARETALDAYRFEKRLAPKERERSISWYLYVRRKARG